MRGKTRGTLRVNLGYDIVKLTPELTEMNFLWVHPQMKTCHGIQSLSRSWVDERRCIMSSS